VVSRWIGIDAAWFDLLIGCHGFWIRTMEFKTQICLSHNYRNLSLSSVGLTGTVKSLSGEEESKRNKKSLHCSKGIQDASGPGIP
jgi:hypothetical protein